MRPTQKLTLLALSVAFAAPQVATAAPFATAEAVPGTARTDSATASAIDEAGRSTLALSVLDGKRFRAALAFGAPGQVPGRLTRVGPAGAYDLALATNAEGVSALTFSVEHRAYLAVCSRGACGATQRIGVAFAKPESVVAVEPGRGRVTVMWRGRGRSGIRRLRWRITTSGKLGRTHTLGEFGDRPRIGTDRSGKTVAIWQDRKDRSLRTAARRVGEFTRPRSVTSDPVTGQQLAVGALGRFVAGWISRSTPIDEQSPMGTAQTATRGDGTNFSAPASHGDAAAVAVAVSPRGRALLSVLGADDRARVSAATSDIGGDFGPLQEVAVGGFVSSTFPPAVAIDDQGNAFVAFSGQPAVGQPAQVTVVHAVDRVFGAPETLSSGAGNGSVGPVTVSAAGVEPTAQVFFTDAGAVQVRRVGLGR